MAVEFEDPIDLNKLEIQNVRLQQLDTDPSGALEGQIWFRNDLHRPKVNDGTVNQELAYAIDIANKVDKNAPIVAGQYTKVNVDAKGLVTAGSSATKADVGLGNVDNTTDLLKPISTATQTALNLKANLASPTFTGTVSGITKAMVGLGNVDNTSDANKPVSTDTQTALNLKANTSHTQAASTITDFSTAVPAVVLSGFVTGANSTILNTDSVEVALEKAQGQLNNKLDTSATTQTKIGQLNVNGGAYTTRALATDFAFAAKVAGNTSDPLTIRANGNIELTNGTGTALGTITPVEFSHLDGATSNIQNQLNNKHDVSFGGTLDVNNFAGLGNKLYIGGDVGSGSWSNKPGGDNSSALLTMRTHPTDYYSQLFFDTLNDGIWHRSRHGGTTRAWTTLIKSNDPALTNARTPTAHAASHSVGGGDQLGDTAFNNVAATGLGFAAGLASWGHKDWYKTTTEFGISQYYLGGVTVAGRGIEVNSTTYLKLASVDIKIQKLPDYDYFGLYGGSVVPNNANFNVIVSKSGHETVINASSGVYLKNANNNIAEITATGMTLPAATTNANALKLGSHGRLYAQVTEGFLIHSAPRPVLLLETTGGTGGDQYAGWVGKENTATNNLVVNVTGPSRLLKFMHRDSTNMTDITVATFAEAGLTAFRNHVPGTAAIDIGTFANPFRAAHVKNLWAATDGSVGISERIVMKDWAGSTAGNLYGAIYSPSLTATKANPAFLCKSDGTTNYLNGTASANLSVGDTTNNLIRVRVTASATGCVLYGGLLTANPVERIACNDTVVKLSAGSSSTSRQRVLVEAAGVTMFGGTTTTDVTRFRCNNTGIGFFSTVPVAQQPQSAYGMTVYNGVGILDSSWTTANRTKIEAMSIAVVAMQTNLINIKDALLRYGLLV